MWAKVKEQLNLEHDNFEVRSSWSLGTKTSELR